MSCQQVPWTNREARYNYSKKLFPKQNQQTELDKRFFPDFWICLYIKSSKLSNQKNTELFINESLIFKKIMKVLAIRLFQKVTDLCLSPWQFGLDLVCLMKFHWKDWCWSWSSNTLATWREKLTQWKRPWCCKRLRAGGEEGDRGWGGWMASLNQWTWVWTNSRRRWGTGKPGVLQSMGSKRVGHDLATEQQQKRNCKLCEPSTLSLFLYS